MNLRMSDLPPELQRQLLDGMGATPRARRPKSRPIRSGLMKSCACGFQIFRPDGAYPEECDGCGNLWPPTP
jgi:hypothetical protein